MRDKNLIIILGQEGAGKTTIISKLGQYIPNSAHFDAESVGQVNPWNYDKKFLNLLWENTIDLMNNFWNYDYNNVITGSFLGCYHEYKEFRLSVPKEVNITIIQLCASKIVRDKRRKKRLKIYDKKESDWIDENYPEDLEFIKHIDEYKYIRIDNDYLTIDKTIEKILNVLNL